MLLAVWSGSSAISFFLATSTTELQWWTSTDGSTSNNDITTSGLATALNTWYAWALDFNGAKYRLYVNGVMKGSFATPRTLFNANVTSIAIGGSSDAVPGSLFFGNIDEVRITKGIARYASDGGYTVTTVPFPR